MAYNKPMNKTTMKNYTIEFFHGQQGVWKRSTMQVFATLEEAKASKKAHLEMCGGCVDFRIMEVA
jgi:hypothetical protein